MKEVHWFELDFKELFDFKLSIIPIEAQLVKSFNPIVYDLSTPNWSKALLQSEHFNPEIKTLWILEGFTGYLTEDEAKSLMQELTAISASGSQIVATFIGTDLKISMRGMH